MFRANFQRNGCYRVPSIRTLPELKWKFRQSPDIAQIATGGWSHFAVENGVVCLERSGGNFYGFDAKNGRQLWDIRSDKSKKINCQGLATKDGIVYARTFNYSLATHLFEDFLYAIEISSGRIIWKITIPNQSLLSGVSSLLSQSAPAIEGNYLYLGGEEGKIYEIDLRSGEITWSFKATIDMTITSLAIEDNILCFCCNDGYLYAIDLLTKELIWKFEIGSFFPIFSLVTHSPAIDRGVVFAVNSRYILHALDAKTGAIIWTFSDNSKGVGYPAIDDRYIYIASHNYFLFALDRNTGKEIWKKSIGIPKSQSSPIVADGTIYLGSEGYIEAIDAENGRQLWQFSTPTPDCWLFDPPMFGNGLLNQFSKLVTGKTLNLERFSEPVIADAIIYTSCSNGYFYALA